MTKRIPIALALLFSSCTPPRHESHVAAVTAAPTPGCLDPVAYGAISGDSMSDRIPFQAAVDAASNAVDGGTVCIGAGRWSMERAPVGSYDRFAAISTHGHHVTIRGVGPETILELAGDQGGSAVAVISIDPGAEHVRIADLTIDTTSATNTDEQTHAIANGTMCAGAACAPIRDLLIERVTYRHPRNTISRKGDCVRLIGNTETTALIGVRIVGSNFEDCARSAVQIQRFVTGLVIANNTMTCSGCDQTIDGEATGGGWDDNLTITGNTIMDRPGVEGDYSITLSSTNRAAITGNTMNRGIGLYRTSMTAITGNSIDASMKTDVGLVDASNVCDGLVITGNTLKRYGHVGPIVKLAPHSGGMCAGAVVAGNGMIQGTGFHAVYMESVSRALISANLITYPAPAPAYSGIYSRSVMAGYPPIVGLGIAGNMIIGAVTYAITLDGSPGTFGAGNSVTGNTAHGNTWGLRCNNAAGFTAAITSSANSIGPSAHPGVTVTPGT